MKTFRFSLTIEVITFKEVVIKAKKSLFSLFKNNRGFTLAEVVIAAGIMGGIAVGMIFLMKQQTVQTLKAENEADLAQAKTKLSTLMVNPANCNANFKGKTVPTTSQNVSTLVTCNGAASNPKCFNAGDTTTVFTAVAEAGGGPTSDTNWPVTTPPTLINKNLKIYSMTLDIPAVTLMPPVPPATTSYGLATATVTVSFSERVVDSKSNPPVVRGRRLGTVSYNTVVVTNGSTVVGCPKSWNSTVVYQ